MYIYVYLHIYIYSYLYTYLYVYIRINMYICLHIYRYVDIYTYIYIYMYIHVYTYIPMYIRTNKHTHTHRTTKGAVSQMFCITSCSTRAQTNASTIVRKSTSGISAVLRANSILIFTAASVSSIFCASTWCVFVCVRVMLCVRERERARDLQQHRFGSKFARASCWKEGEEVRFGERGFGESEREGEPECVCLCGRASARE